MIFSSLFGGVAGHSLRVALTEERLGRALARPDCALLACPAQPGGPAALVVGMELMPLEEANAYSSADVHRRDLLCR